MALSSIALCSRALLKVGANTISSFDEGTAEAEIAVNLYPSVRDALISSHPWSFALAQASLPRLTAEPVADFDFAFQLPTDFLRVMSAGIAGRGRGANYRLAENKLHTNVSQVVLTYVFRPDEMIFPAFFDQVLISRLAAEFCLPLTESTSRAEFLIKISEEEFRRAKLIDAQQGIPEAIDDFPLIEVRS
ncbi:MAG: hypothetical protein KAJ75_07220 [Alphaproteobacteria bacterium]|nr:hypothetical protein [Alphaproteobacteria bacterium]